MSASPTSDAPPRASSAAAARDPTPGPVLRPSLLQEETRRSSISFLPQTNAAHPTGNPKGQRRDKRRMSSPPPPPVFQPRVSFDTFNRATDNIEENAFTLIAKHKDYEYTKRSRTFLCGCDDNDYSDYALQWLIDELVDDGDEIVCLRVLEKAEGVGDGSAENARYQKEAKSLMKQFQNKNHENKAINLILEFAVGKVNKVIDEMINLYEPAILVVGTRGRNLGGFQGLLPGSVSKYCLQSSPVPVIVVLPSSKRDKSRVKRAQDPNRQSYKELLEKSGTQGTFTRSSSNRNSFMAPEDAVPASRDEAAAVARAIGYKAPKAPKAPKGGASPLAQVTTPPDEIDDPTPFVTRKRKLRNLDSAQSSAQNSAQNSDESNSEEENGGDISGITEELSSVSLDKGKGTARADSTDGGVLSTTWSPRQNKGKGKEEGIGDTEGASSGATDTN